MLMRSINSSASLIATTTVRLMSERCYIYVDVDDNVLAMLLCSSSNHQLNKYLFLFFISARRCALLHHIAVHLRLRRESIIVNGGVVMGDDGGHRRKWTPPVYEEWMSASEREKGARWCSGIMTGCWATCRRVTRS